MDNRPQTAEFYLIIEAGPWHTLGQIVKKFGLLGNQNSC